MSSAPPEPPVVSGDVPAWRRWLTRNWRSWAVLCAACPLVAGAVAALVTLWADCDSDGVGLLAGGALGVAGLTVAAVRVPARGWSRLCAVVLGVLLTVGAVLFGWFYVAISRCFTF